MNVVRLVDLCGVDCRIRDLTLRDMVLMGPAMLAVLDYVTIAGTALDLGGGTPEAHFVTVPAGSVIFGAIGLERVRIERCQLQNVAFIGNPEQMAMLLAGFSGVDSSTTMRPPPFYDQLLRNETTGEPTP